MVLNLLNEAIRFDAETASAKGADIREPASPGEPQGHEQVVHKTSPQPKCQCLIREAKDNLQNKQNPVRARAAAQRPEGQPDDLEHGFGLQDPIGSNSELVRNLQRELENEQAKSNRILQ